MSVAPRYLDATCSVPERVDDLLARMTIEEKVAQLCSVWLNQSPVDYASFTAGVEHLRLDDRVPHGIGGISRPFGSGPLPVDDAAAVVDDVQRWLVEHTRLGIPALVHDECLTGLMAAGCTTMPAPLNWGATFDPDLVTEMASAIRAQLLAAGVHQGLAPVLDVVRDQRYGRVEECIAEDAYLVGVVGAAFVAGLQGPVDELVATVKHFAAHAMPEAGHNAAPVHVGERELRDVHLLPFEMAVHAGAGAVMTAYHDIDGVPATADPMLLHDVLRTEWEFDGLVVSDYWALDFLHERHRVASGKREAAVLGARAGVDMELPVESCYPHLVAAVVDGALDEAVVDRSVTRVLTTKFRLGLFERAGRTGGSTDSAAMRSVARRVAAASLTLLTNRAGVLPLGPDVRRIAVVGPNATSGESLCGNYAYVNHVGYLFPESPHAPVPAAVDAIARRAARAGMTMTGVDDADVIIVVGGDRAGHLGIGTVGEGSDTDDLTLPGDTPDVLAAAAASGRPVVFVHVAGRAHDLTWAADHVGAIITCWLPGSEGAAAIAGALFGDVNPAGRTPLTFARSAGQQPAFYDNRPLARQDYGRRSSCEPAFSFGHGLSYTTFEYCDLDVDPTVSVAGTLRIACTVANTGGRSGDEVVQVYIGDPVASVVRPIRQLRAFERVHLSAGASARLTFELPTDLLGFAGRDGRRIVEPGDVTVEVGASSDDIRLAATVVLTGTTRAVTTPAELRHRSSTSAV